MNQIMVDDRNYMRLIKLCHALRSTNLIVTFNDAVDYVFSSMITDEDLDKMYEKAKL